MKAIKLISSPAKPCERHTWILNARLQQYEEELLRQALVEHNWNQSHAAKALEIPEQTLRYKMNKLGIIKPN